MLPPGSNDEGPRGRRFVGMVEFVPPAPLKDVPDHSTYEVKPTRPSKPGNKPPRRRRRD
jgi:hypothetical protein